MDDTHPAPPATPTAAGASTPPPLAAPPARPVLLPPLILLRDLEGQLIWPRLLRTPGAALWPSRLMLGTAGALLVGLIGSLPSLWSNRPGFITAFLESQGAAWDRVLGAAMQGSVGAGVAGLRGVLIESPLALVAAYPVSTPLLGAIMLAIVVAFGGAIARSVGVESATDRRPSAARMLGWSLARWPSAFAGVLAPLVVLWIMLVLMRSLGWLGLGLPVLDVVGGLLFPVLAILGIATVALMLALGFTGALIVPARMIEDSDAIDAMQRSFAYGVARPLRLLVYLALTLGVCGVGLGLARALLEGGWSLAVGESGAWISPEHRAAFTGVMPGAADGTARTLPTTTAIARWLIGVWSEIPTLLVAGYAISLFFTGGTRVYLAIRQVCDGQDPAEVQGESRDESGAERGS